MPRGQCSVSGCMAERLARGFCKGHYNRWHYYGDPLAGGVASSACAHCGEDVPAKGATGPRSRYCSKVCQRQASYQRRRGALRDRRVADRAASRGPKSCPVCGDQFLPEKTSRQVYCSKRCSRQLQNAGRRARTRGSATVEKLHWRILYASDGPLCHVCGYETDPTDFVASNGSRSFGPAYPSLDHVVSLAMGGLHVRENVRLAHFYCNSVKGAKALADFV